MSKKKTYTNRDVSRIVRRRTKELRKRVNELSAENKVLREVLISGFKEWYEENKDEKELNELARKENRD